MYCLRITKIDVGIVVEGGYVKVEDGIVKMGADVKKADHYKNKEDAERARVLLLHGAKKKLEVEVCLLEGKKTK